MESQQAASGFPEIRVPAALTFAALVLGFIAGTLLRGSSVEASVLAVAQPAGTLWLRALQLTILPLVIGLVYTGISQTLAAAGYSDRVFNMARVWADLRFIDPSLDPSRRPANRCYAGEPRRANFGPANIGVTSSLRTWLNMWSLEHGQCRGAPHLSKLQLPALVIQSLADTGVFPSDAQRIYDLLGSQRKSLHLIDGDHYLTAPDTATTL